MIIDDGFEYRGYRVHCAANATADGRFAADLMITRVTPDRLLERHFTQVASCASQREAFEYARQIGTTWIDAQEQMPPPSTPLSAPTSFGVHVS
jgi:hypothetical protein